MTSPASPYIAPEASSEKKWWDPLGLFASKSAPVSAPSEYTPAVAGRRRHRRRGGVLPKNSSFTRPITAKSQLNAQREMIKLAVKNSMKQKANVKAKGGRKTKKHSRK
jgi:hypothetical protein